MNGSDTVGPMVALSAKPMTEEEHKKWTEEHEKARILLNKKWDELTTEEKI